MNGSFARICLYSLAFVLLFAFRTAAQTESIRLDTTPIDLKGCIQWVDEKYSIIADRESYLEAIRRDASRDRCLSDVEPIDFAKNTLVGIELNTGYCRTPVGLGHALTRDDTKKEFVLNISWTDPQGSVCRALSRYDLWVLVPKIPAGYTFSFETDAKPK